MAVTGVGFILSVLALAQLGLAPPLIATVLYAFLSIRLVDASILDFLRYAMCFLFLKQQYFEWRKNADGTRALGASPAYRILVHHRAVADDSHGPKSVLTAWLVPKRSIHPHIHHPGELFLNCPALGIDMHPLGQVLAEDAWARTRLWSSAGSIAHRFF